MSLSGLDDSGGSLFQADLLVDSGSSDLVSTIVTESDP